MPEEGTQQPGTTQQTPAPGTTQQTPAPAAIPWLGNADELTVGYVQNKGWTEPGQVLDSYRNLEKLFGADRAGNTVVLPKPDAPQAEVDAFYSRLGRPADPSGYKFTVPEGASPDFAKAAAEKLHELGAPQKLGEGLARWWNDYAAAAQQASNSAREQAYAEQDTALKTEWGAAFQQNVLLAQTAAKALGVQPEEVDHLAETLGHKRTMELFHKIGSRVAEPDFASSQQREGFGAMSPAQAKARIQELSRDREFVSRYVNKNADAVAEMARLHGFAYPEGM